MVLVKLARLRGVCEKTSVRLLFHCLLIAVALGSGRLSAQDSATTKAVLDSSSIVHYLDPYTSFPGGIKQSLRGLGWLDPTPKMLRTTSVIPSTREHLTYQDWPLTNGLMAKGWMSGGLPAFYAPAVEPVMIEAPDIENTRTREPNAYYYFHREKIEIKPPSFNNKQLVAPDFERPQFVDPEFERPQYDLRNVAASALKRFPAYNRDVEAGGIRHSRHIAAQVRGEDAAPRRRFRAASFWDVNTARNDPRSGVDPEVRMETRRRTFWQANFNFRNPNEHIDPKDPKPSYAVRPYYLPEYRGARFPGGQ